MQFDPTYDYGKKDLTVDRYLICWKFAELIKNLITLSGNAEKQMEWNGLEREQLIMKWRLTSIAGY